MPSTIVQGVCCQYCLKFEEHSCPVKTASPWSRWKNYCSEYAPNNKEYPEALPLIESIEKGRAVVL